jgi:hypothetical protein
LKQEILMSTAQMEINSMRELNFDEMNMVGGADFSWQAAGASMVAGGVAGGLGGMALGGIGAAPGALAGALAGGITYGVYEVVMLL